MKLCCDCGAELFIRFDSLELIGVKFTCACGLDTTVSYIRISHVKRRNSLETIRNFFRKLHCSPATTGSKQL